MPSLAPTTASAASARRLRAAVDRNLDLAGRDDVEAVSRLSLPDDRLPRSDADRLEPAGEALEDRRGQRREDRNRPQELELAVAVD